MPTKYPKISLGILLGGFGEQAAPLMNSITTPKLHLLYAQAKEAEGDYIAACQAYEKARDLDAVVRLNLDHMRNPQHAMQVVRETRSTEVRKFELQLRRICADQAEL